MGTGEATYSVRVLIRHLNLSQTHVTTLSCGFFIILTIFRKLLTPCDVTVAWPELKMIVHGAQIISLYSFEEIRWFTSLSFWSYP